MTARRPLPGGYRGRMRIEVPHRWPRDAAEAVAVQEELRGRVDRSSPGPADPELVAGIDVAYAGAGAAAERVAAAVVVLRTRTLQVAEQATAVGDAAFPYVPGLFAFRELPVVIEALNRLSLVPEVLFCDGQGVAHPRRFGLASHLGVLTGLPSVGVAKTPFTGTWDASALGADRGARVPLVDAGEEVGSVLRTQRGVKPVFVSVGHAVDLDTACRQVLALAPRYRLPETTRAADRLCRAALAADRPAPAC